VSIIVMAVVAAVIVARTAAIVAAPAIGLHHAGGEGAQGTGVNDEMS
jgi:hypothetical protein